MTSHALGGILAMLFWTWFRRRYGLGKTMIAAAVMIALVGVVAARADDQPRDHEILTHIPTRGERCSGDDWWKDCHKRASPNDKRLVECFAVAIRDVPSTRAHYVSPFLAKTGDTFIVSGYDSKIVDIHGGYGLPRNAIRFLTACPNQNPAGEPN